MFPKTPTLSVSTALGALLLLAGLDAAAQTSIPPKTNWVVGSDELIRIALTNNLSILMSEIQPQIDELGLKGLYGAYEPNLTANMTHTYNSSPGGFYQQPGAGLLFYPSETAQANYYTPGLTGVAPWGLSYNFTGPLSEQNVSGAPDSYESSPNVSLTQPLLKNFWINS